MYTSDTSNIPAVHKSLESQTCEQTGTDTKPSDMYLKFVSDSHPSTSLSLVNILNCSDSGLGKCVIMSDSTHSFEYGMTGIHELTFHMATNGKSGTN